MFKNVLPCFFEWVTMKTQSCDGRVLGLMNAIPKNKEIVNYFLQSDATIFAIESSGEEFENDARIIRCMGRFDEVGDIIELPNGVEVAMVSYRASPFIVGTGPTCISISCSEDFDAFIEDADAAYDSGVFESCLAKAHTAIMDIAEFCRDDSSNIKPNRFIVDSNGVVKSGISGMEFMDIVDLNSYQPAKIFSGIADEEFLQNSLWQRPWLSRYVSSLGFMSSMNLADEKIRISGFGWSILSNYCDAILDPKLPIIANIDDMYVVWISKKNKAFKVSKDIATVLEHQMLALNGYTVPGITEILGVSNEAAQQAVSKVQDLFL